MAESHVLLVTTKGILLLEKSSAMVRFKGKKSLKEKGFFFNIGHFWKGTFPEYFQDTFHTEDYIFKRWSEYFDILKFIPRGMPAGQDIVILQNK